MLRGSLVVVAVLLALAGAWLLQGDHARRTDVAQAIRAEAPVAPEPPGPLIAPPLDPAQEVRRALDPWSTPDALPERTPVDPAREGATLTVTVRDTDGAPLHGARVGLLDSSEWSTPQGRVRALGTRELGPEPEFTYSSHPGPLSSYPRRGARVRGDPRWTTDPEGRVVLELDRLPSTPLRAIAFLEGRVDAVSEPVEFTKQERDAQAEIVLARGGGISGSLRDLEGQPAQHVVILASRNQPDSTGLTLGVAQVETDEDGRFVFETLAAGRWTLRTESSERLSVLVPAQSIEVDVVAGEWSFAHFPDLGGTAVHVTGQVLRDGKGVGGGSVFVRPVRPTGSAAESEVSVDRQGRFQVCLARPGRYEFETLRMRGWTGTQEIEIPPGPRFEVVLESTTVELCGTVYGPDGRSLSGVYVAAAPQEAGRHRAGYESAGTMSDEQGGYSLTGLHDGTFTLRAHPPGFSSTGPAMGELHLRDVVLTPNLDLVRLDLRLPAIDAVRGRVSDERGRPIDGALIQVRGTQGTRSVLSDRKGRFELSAPVGSSCWLRASRDRSTSDWTRVDVGPGAAAETSLVLRQGATVRIELEDYAGPVAQASVSLESGDPAAAIQVSVRDGWGIAFAVPPATYRAVARREADDPNSPTATTLITLARGEEQTLRLRLP